MVIVSQASVLLKTDLDNEFNIIKSDNLVIGGYASIEIVDKQNDLITLDALQEATIKYMGEKKFRNVMTNHSNVQVGEVLDNYRDKNGKLWKTEVDDVGLFVVIKMRDDIEKAKEVSRGIRKGTLRSFSIGGQALSKKKKNHKELGEYSEIEKLELHEVTICEKGINPEAKFDILKMEKGSEIMTEKLEKALDELEDLLKEVKDLQKEEGEDMTEETKEEYMDTADDEEKEDMDEEKGDMYMKDDEMDMEAKGRKDIATGEVEDNVPEDRVVIENGKPKGGNTLKGINVDTLDLSAENIEKAYAQFRAEQLEKLAYGDVKKQFEARFQAELDANEVRIAKENYSAEDEVNALKEEFADLRKSLLAEKEAIVKAQTEASALPDNFPTSMDDIAKMDWNELHDLVREFE
jgi:HK97 family phage prohead protease